MGHEDPSVLEGDSLIEGWKGRIWKENWAWVCVHADAAQICLRIPKERSPLDS